MKDNIKKFDLLISCPSDVEDEISIINEVIKKLNSMAFAKDTFVVSANHWKDVVPLSGMPPQSVINDEIVNNTDFVVAIFNNRIGGNPDDNYDSGTVKEINIVRESNKQIFLYFKKQNEDFLGDEQYKKLLEYKQTLKNNIYKEYKSLDDFKELFDRDINNYLHLYMRKQSMDKKYIEEKNISSVKSVDEKIQWK